MTGPLSIEDRVLIQELYARYSWAMDTGDVEAMKKVFVEDCAYEGWNQVWAGRDYLSQTLIDFHHKLDIGVQHHAANFVMEGDANRCIVMAQNYGFHYAKDASTIRYVGFYVDNVVKQSGQWYFRKRYYAEWEGPITVEGRELIQSLKQKALS